MVGVDTKVLPPRDEGSIPCEIAPVLYTIGALSPEVTPLLYTIANSVPLKNTVYITNKVSSLHLQKHVQMILQAC